MKQRRYVVEIHDNDTGQVVCYWKRGSDPLTMVRQLFEYGLLDNDRKMVLDSSCLTARVRLWRNPSDPWKGLRVYLHQVVRAQVEPVPEDQNG